MRFIFLSTLIFVLAGCAPSSQSSDSGAASSQSEKSPNKSSPSSSKTDVSPPPQTVKEVPKKEVPKKEVPKKEVPEEKDLVPATARAVLHPKIPPSNIFETLDVCEKQLNKSKECFQGYSTAAAVHIKTAPKYKSIDLCENVFKKCIIDTDRQAVPSFGGFALVLVDAKDPKKGAFYLPLYKSTSDKWVEVEKSGDKINLISID